MRCKNCGTENDDNRYICENCGSPLYDEEDFNSNSQKNQQTTTFSALSNQEALDLGITPQLDDDQADSNNISDKKSIIVIAILAVVLIAIIAAIGVVAHTRAQNNKSTTESTTISTTASTTKQTTTKQTTTKQTTTQESTTTTTEQQAWSIKLVSQGGGTVEGSGSYKDGDNVTISAIPDDGYEFDGWYSNGIRLSSTRRYSFTATEDLTISAIFNAVTTTAAPEVDDSEIIDGGIE